MTLERIVPDDLAPGDAMLAEHVERYEMAAALLEPGDQVVDAACGVGYGAAMLAPRCAQVTGLDRDASSVAYAETRYGASGARFAVADLECDPLPACDVLVSFETVEHLREPGAFLRAAIAQARRLVVLSVPLGPTTAFNPHHLHDFERDHIGPMMAPWHEVYFCYQSGANGGVYGVWAFSPDDCPGAFRAINLAHQQRQFALHHARLSTRTESEAGRQWLEEQYLAWKTEAERLHDCAREQKSAKDWLEGQVAAWKAEAERLHAWTDELQAAKDWLEGQYLTLKAEAERLRANDR